MKRAVVGLLAVLALAFASVPRSSGSASAADRTAAGGSFTAWSRFSGCAGG